MTRRRKVLAFNQSSRLALPRLQVLLATSERLPERLERTATPRGGGECAWTSVGYRARGLSDPALRIKGDDDDDDDGMECAWRGSSGRSSSPVGGGEGSRSRRHCAD